MLNRACRLVICNRTIGSASDQPVCCLDSTRPRAAVCTRRSSGRARARPGELIVPVCPLRASFSRHRSPLSAVGPAATNVRSRRRSHAVLCSNPVFALDCRERPFSASGACSRDASLHPSYRQIRAVSSGQLSRPAVPVRVYRRPREFSLPAVSASPSQGSG